MARQSTLIPEQVAKVEEMLKAGAKTADIVKESGAKDYQVVSVKRRLGMVKPRKKAAKAKAKAKAAPAVKKAAKAAKSAPLTVSAIRANLETAQKEVVRWQEQMVTRVTEIEKMISTIRKS